MDWVKNWRTKHQKRTQGPDVLQEQQQDRRMLSDVPDPSMQRKNADRRGGDIPDFNTDFEGYIKWRKGGIRYRSDFPVQIDCRKGAQRIQFEAHVSNISDRGLCAVLEEDQRYFVDMLQSPDAKITLRFEITQGTMPEGYEMRVKTHATCVRTLEKNGTTECGFHFAKSISTYAERHKDSVFLLCSAILLTFISAVILLMRCESIIYFKYHSVTYLYSIVTAVFLLSRYLFGALYHPVKIDPEYTPSVTVIIPCFNEEEWIQRTILSCLNQHYPADKLEVIIVDDCSTDRSVEKIKELVERLYRTEAESFDVKNRLSYYVQPQNAGKRAALVRGVIEAKGELVIFVDSDSFLDVFAVRNLVQPFRDPKMGGVAGRTDVANTYTNSLTRMQSVRYYIAFRMMKAAESIYDTVTCLSGPLSCYRKSLVMQYKDDWINQKFLGQKATFGDDRAMTNFILSHHRTAYQDTAVCFTIVPNKHRVFLKQQMRWKRSWLRESLMAGAFMWRKEPFASIFFYIGLLVPILAPIVVLYNLVWVPIAQHIFPKTFLVGLLMMSLMMSIAQMNLRKSSTWVYGFLFCFYYEMVLLWQMPVAWVTFWKSTWGTRMTPSDEKAAEKKTERAKRKKKRRKHSEEEQLHEVG